MRFRTNHTGVPRREGTYDDYRLVDNDNAVFLLSDGMGGHPLPDEAAELAVRTAYHRIMKDVHDFGDMIPEDEILNSIYAAIHHSNECLFKLGTGVKRM
jgi:serine/threonine protein phosphatase PrpC